MDVPPMETRSSEDPDVRKAFSESILHLLRPLSALEMAESVVQQPSSRCDSAISGRSGLSEPFSDLDESYILLDQRAKQPGSDEGDDMMLLNQFTAEFRHVYDQLLAEQQQREQQPGPAVEVENAEDLLLPPSDSAAGEAEPEPDARRTSDFPMFEAAPSGFSAEFQSFIDEMLHKCNLKHHLDEQQKQQSHRGRGRRQRKVQPIDPKEQQQLLLLEPADRDSLSGVWCMLDAVSEPNGFPITDGPYDLYEDERFAWLLGEDIPWARLEVSRKRCEQWLKMGPTASKTDEKRSQKSHKTYERNPVLVRSTLHSAALGSGSHCPDSVYRVKEDKTRRDNDDDYIFSRSRCPLEKPLRSRCETIMV
ncbi:uncharacterized protein LOC126579034 [Anopheles aquasalis]|uniref:uncharacterized protein LOC126579034 n=1 Tax=Anopheles aquasalis TaxID=42839 RepID=UPI00215B6D64|nr:uncharacterized protein LOC126579034 [Anopheles aquasalis]